MADIRNHVLAALPRQAAADLLAQLAPARLVFGEVLYEAAQPIRHVDPDAMAWWASRSRLRRPAHRCGRRCTAAAAR